MVLISIIYIFMIKRKEMQLRGLACEEDDLKRQVLEEMRVGDGFQWGGEAQKTATPVQVWTHDGF